MQLLLKQVNHRAAEYGHSVQWETLGTSMAHGRCTNCGAFTRVILEPNGVSSVDEQQLVVTCPSSPNDVRGHASASDGGKHVDDGVARVRGIERA